MELENAYILTLSCRDRTGLVAAVAGLLFHNGANILESQQFDDLTRDTFFMRVVFSVPSSDALGAIRAGIASAIASDEAHWRIRACSDRKRVLLLVSKFDHCLDDLLYRLRIGELPMEVVAIVSNHPLEALNTPLIGNIPFHHLPIDRNGKAQQEAQIRRLVEDNGVELVVLARYMQILSEQMCRFLEGRCINIHHSFLPGFKGARPYHQAHERGVKMIGATAHFVTVDLDEGPIIVQDVEPITHADSPEDLVRKGRDIERRVLARAVHHYLEDRVFPNGNKTVVFPS
ncbi:MAG: formyltetrahydrofolate deformylase [Steroidobacteraceae bacterium]